MSTLNTSILGYSIPRSYFNLSKRHYFTTDSGILRPVYCKLLLPNDLFKCGVSAVVRQNPTIAPSYSPFTLKFRWFVVSIRNLNKDLYRFLSGYKEYSKETKYEEPLHYWKPSTPEKTKAGSLWTALGYPANCVPDDESLPMDYPRLAYNYIWNEYFRNQTIQDSILTDGDPSQSTNEDLLRVNNDRNYFTTCLPVQQLADPIGIGLVGNTKAVFDSVSNIPLSVSGEFPQTRASGGVYLADTNNLLYAPANSTSPSFKSSKTAQFNASSFVDILSKTISSSGTLDLSTQLANNTVDLSSASTILITDLIKSFALQTMATMNAFGGIRDNEFLLTHFGISPSDETLGRPYYIGGGSIPILTSEVLQHSATTNDSALGQMGGHGIGLGRGRQVRFHAKEFCILMCLAYIKPATVYGSQGIKREFTLRSRFDFPFPVLGKLSAQPVFMRELLCASSEKIKKDYTSLGKDDTASVYNGKIFGWRPVFDWTRYDTDSIDGQFLYEQFYKDDGTIETVSNDSNWTESIFYSIKDGERPTLNDEFLRCEPDKRNYVLTDNKLDADSFKIVLNFNIHAWRPVHKFGVPANLAG